MYEKAGMSILKKIAIEVNNLLPDASPLGVSLYNDNSDIWIEEDVIWNGSFEYRALLYYIIMSFLKSWNYRF